VRWRDEQQRQLHGVHEAGKQVGHVEKLCPNCAQPAHMQHAASDHSCAVQLVVVVLLVVGGDKLSQ
jgi:hypothetical protein